MSAIMGREVSLDEARAIPLAKWGPRACRATGTETEHQQHAAEDEFFALLGALERQLETTRYALGDRPCAADTILLGGLRAHTNHDPIPNLAAFPRVVAWDEHAAAPWASDGELAPFPGTTPFANHVLEIARDRYAPFLLGNAHALERGDKSFVIETFGEPTSYLARRYPERSRTMIRARIRDRLTADERKSVLNWLEGRGLRDCFAP